MKSLNPGIKRTVEWLNASGFRTTDSGDGRTHYYECDRPIPYVVILVAAHQMVEEIHRLAVLLEGVGVVVEPMNEDNSAPNIQGTFDAAWDEAVIDLTNVSNELIDWSRAEKGGRDA